MYAVNVIQTVMHQTEVVKYVGLNFDCRLNWEEHIVRKRQEIDLKTKNINWLIGEKIPSFYRKQITYHQSGNQTDMELWNKNVALCHQVQHSHHAEIPIQNSQSHSKFTPMCNKSYSTYRIQHPLRK